MKNANLPAYPTIVNGAGSEIDSESQSYAYYASDGLTKREIFAMAALRGHLSSRDFTNVSYTNIARNSVKAADALLNALDDIDE